jgi:pyruvate/2-oxoglutarate dehydrogenase complex dihydrolipoamide dehydrogenase (E3) component
MDAESTSLDFDVVIIGGGSAGYAAARSAAAGGLRTAVVEGGSDVGGLCILRGCMPSKALLYAAEVLHLARHAETWGLYIPQAGFDFERVMDRKNSMIQDFADHRVKQLSTGNFVFIRAKAAFLDPHRIELDNGQILTARYFIISTGSAVAPPPWASLADAGYWTSDDVLRLKAAPPSLIVLGGGAVAVEFAQFFARFDTEVTMIQRSPHILHSFDADLTGELENVLREEGMSIFTGTTVEQVSSSNGVKRVAFRQGEELVEVEAEEILLALGRVPAVEGLALEKAGVVLTDGRIQTDARMRTNVPHIFAAGDCTGPNEIVHIAVQQGEIAAHNILRQDQPREMDYRMLISVVFSDPQAATVGLTERAAKEAGVAFIGAAHPFKDHGKALLMEAKHGFVKLLADPVTGEILGGAVLGPAGGELIHEIVAAMAKRMTVHELAAMPHYHPTLAEIWTYPAEELAGKIRKTD